MRLWMILLALLAVAALATISASTAQAAQASRISPAVRGELLKDAKLQAAKLPGAKRSLRDIQAVLTTEAKAWELENQSRGVNLPCASCGTGSVYLVAMLDARECKPNSMGLMSCATHPPVLMFWVSPSTMKVEHAAHGGTYPNLTSLGVPTPLQGAGA